MARSAASDSGARPRFVCRTTPVALITSWRDVAVSGNPATAASTTAAGSNAPWRACCCAAATASLTVDRPSRVIASASRPSARTTSVRGTLRRESGVITHLRPYCLAEADGNRTRQAELLDFTGFEDREGHQAPVRLRRRRYRRPMPGYRRRMTIAPAVRLTQYAH